MDEAVLENAAALRIQRALIVDYGANVDPRWQNYLREHEPRTLIVWGKGDEAPPIRFEPAILGAARE
jgi:hypothetical protein